MTVENGRLLLIAEPRSFRIGAYLAAAKQMDLDVLIASQGRFSLISEVHEGLHIDLRDQKSSLDTILQVTRHTRFDGVLGIDDSTVELAASVARALELPHNSPAAARLTQRKDLARAHLAHAGCPVPAHWIIDLARPLNEQMKSIKFPCVVKPLTLSASRGVILANDEEELVAACRRVEPMLSERSDSFERRHLLVELYINGVEVAYEGFLHRGELTTLAIFDKPDPLIGPFFEETIYVTPSSLSENLQNTIKHRVAMACQAYGLTTGPVHAELRINGTEAWILEVAARTIGGDCARSLDHGSEYNLEALAISLAVGEVYDLQLPDEARGVMMIPVREHGILRRVEGLSEARNVRHIEQIDIVTRTGNELIPLPEGSQYPGFIFARAGSPDEVVVALNEACNRLNFVIAPVLKAFVRH